VSRVVKLESVVVKMFPNHAVARVRGICEGDPSVQPKRGAGLLQMNPWEVIVFVR